MAASPLPAVVAFARVAHHASFTRAAAERGVSASALSQAVRALEAQLGVRLLHRAGLGLAQGFESVVAADVAAGRLLRVLDGWQQPFAGFHLYYPARDHLAPKLRVFIDHLRAANAAAG
ncbi:LysR family transcriptional regulator [Xanthomonas translucens pv. graminis]|uniref:LysR family transcriptional regulator n=1 Tax=Xanthomonas graminis TaxID=3390026 RepID=UPI00253FF33B|nr:LysR family transcriptional regulator [Xanthomonas translucens]WIH04577.1 LysR family transcriptional regulator [Xanthomonas translucens pv. graminis]